MVSHLGFWSLQDRTPKPMQVVLSLDSDLKASFPLKADVSYPQCTVEMLVYSILLLDGRCTNPDCVLLHFLSTWALGIDQVVESDVPNWFPLFIVGTAEEGDVVKV